MGAGSGRRALLIVDVQNDFCPGGSLAVSGGDRVIEVINRISPLFDLVIATRDWHPAGHVSFASSHPGRKPLEVVEADGIPQVLWPDHCVQGTEGADFHPDLDLRFVDLIVHKGTSARLDSYSAFFENDRVSPTGLGFYLSGLGCSAVYVTGLATDYCVSSTAADALKLGFTTTVVVDAARGVDLPAGSVERALAALERDGARLRSSSEIGEP